MATELQKHLRGSSANVLTDIVAGEIAIIEDRNSLYAMFEDGVTVVELASLERLDDTGAGVSGAALIGVDQTSFSVISGADVQAALESIDTSIASITSFTTSFTQGSVIFADSGGNLTEDNAGLSFNSTTNALTVGGNIITGANSIGGSGSGLSFSGADATFAGNVSISKSAPTLTMANTTDNANIINISANRTSAGASILAMTGIWDGTDVVRVSFLTGDDTVNKDNGRLRIQTSSAGTLVTALLIDENQDATFGGDIITGTNSIGGAGTGLSFSGAAGTFSSTLDVTGIQSNSEAIAFVSNGTGSAGRIYRSSTGGIAIRGITGSTNDFMILSASGVSLFTNPTGTSNITLGGGGGDTTFGGDIITGTNSIGGAGTGLSFSGADATFAGDISIGTNSIGSSGTGLSFAGGDATFAGSVALGGVLYTGAHTIGGSGVGLSFSGAVASFSSNVNVNGNFAANSGFSSWATTPNFYANSGALTIGLRSDYGVYGGNNDITIQFNEHDAANADVLMGYDSSADALVFGFNSNTLGTNNAMSMSAANGDLTISNGVDLVLNGETRFGRENSLGAGATSAANANSGRDNIGGYSVIKLTPTAGNTHYGFSGLVAGNMYLIVNTTSESAYIVTAGSDTVQHLLTGDATSPECALMYYDGTNQYFLTKT